LAAGTWRRTSTVKETNQRSAVRVIVAAKMRAVFCSRRRASLRVDSWVLSAPIRGSVMGLRSASTRSGPVVNRHQFALLQEGVVQVARVELAGHVVTVRARRWPIQTVQLIQVTDLAPYLDGRRQLIARLLTAPN
jgi:hypothetical protein